MAKELTRERLQELGVTEVTYDAGIIYVNNKERKPVVVKGPYCKYSGKQKEYLAIVFTDKSVKRTVVRSNGKETWTYRTETIPVHRIVYAWFEDKVPSDMDVDHIDDDTFNNAFDNLQLLSHKENIKKRGVGKNQYTATMKQEDILTVRRIKEEIKFWRGKWHQAIKDKDELNKNVYKATISELEDILARDRAHMKEEMLINLKHYEKI